MISKNKNALGKGLGALLGENNIGNDNINSVIEVSIYDIDPNIEQPRKNFDDEKLKTLSESIKAYGVVQPIIVKKQYDRYRIIAGERRWRAARLAGLREIPVIVKDYSDKNEMEVALIENLQRQDLNSIEEAEAYERLMKEHDITQEQLSVIVGKSRPSIANCLRLLSLDEEIKKLVISGDITEGHARALITCIDTKMRIDIAHRIIKEKLSVREVEKITMKIKDNKKDKKVRKEDIKLSDEYNHLQEKIQNALGTRVKLTHKGNNGSILIEYYSNEELERILALIGIS